MEMKFRLHYTEPIKTNFMLIYLAFLIYLSYIFHTLPDLMYESIFKFSVQINFYL